MKKTIIIKGDDNDILSVSLEDILKCINPIEGMLWGLLWFDATFNEDMDDLIVALTKDVNKTKDGISISWEELENLCIQINQGLEVLIIGDEDVSNIIRYKTDLEMYANCSYVIELVDSSYWLVHTSDHLFIDHIINRLPGVAYID